MVRMSRRIYVMEEIGNGKYIWIRTGEQSRSK